MATKTQLTGDGSYAQDVLYQIRTGKLRGAKADQALAEARYLDFKVAQRSENNKTNGEG